MSMAGRTPAEFFITVSKDFLPTSFGAVSLNNPPGQRLLSIGFSSSDTALFIVGFIIILISRIMKIGSELQNEQDSTVQAVSYGDKN